MTLDAVVDIKQGLDGCGEVVRFFIITLVFGQHATQFFPSFPESGCDAITQSPAGVSAIAVENPSVQARSATWAASSSGDRPNWKRFCAGGPFGYNLIQGQNRHLQVNRSAELRNSFLCLEVR